MESHATIVRTHYGYVWTPKKSATFTHWKSTPVHQVPRTPTTAHERVLRGATCVMCKPTCFACVPTCAQRVVWRRVFLRVYTHLRNYVRPRNRATKSPPQRGEDFRSEVLTLRVSWLFSQSSWVSPFAPLEQPQRLACLFELRSKPPRQRSSLALARLCRECYVPCSRPHRPTWFSAR